MPSVQRWFRRYLTISADSVATTYLNASAAGAADPSFGASLHNNSRVSTTAKTYRRSTGIWYIINSSYSSFTLNTFGLSRYKPATADSGFSFVEQRSCLPRFVADLSS
jgi:hypothetical protein